MPTPQELVAELNTALQRQQYALRKLDAYYEGEQPLRYMAPALQAQFGDRLTQLVINWPSMVADAYENRLDVTGFRVPDDGEETADQADADVWGLWLDNDMEIQSQQAHLEAIVLGRSYAVVGRRSEDDTEPLITVEHPFQMVTTQDPRTRQVTAALKRWKDEDGVLRATLYLPDATHHYRWVRRWSEVDRDEHGLGEVPVERLINRQRMLRDCGKSEFASVIPVADAANKMATDMMISGEFHAMPRRWVFGMGPDDFQDEQGNPLSTWEQIAGRVWATDKPPGEVAAGQFPESDLTAFHSTLRVLAQITAQLAGLPPHYMSFTTDNPASADAIRSSEAQLVKRVERKQTGFGASWRRVMRLALRIRDGERFDAERVRRMETVWRDASTPTIAQVRDAAVKTYQAGISTLRQTREDVGYTPGQIRRMEAEDREAVEQDPLRSLERQMSLGREAPDPEPVTTGAGT